MRLAAIDVGSNSIHMVVAEVAADGHFRVLDRVKDMVRLGHRSLSTGRLSRSAMDRGIETLKAFRTLAERRGVARFRVMATSAVREAANGGDFIQRVRDEVGLRLRVIPGLEEARLIHLAVSQVVDLRGEPAVIVDAGGGSVEMILVEREQAVSMHSFKVGVSRLSERFFRKDPPSASQLRALQAHLEHTLGSAVDAMRPRRVRTVVGTSGTFLTLFSMAAYRRGDHPGSHFNNYEVAASEIAGVHRILRKADREQRLKLKGLDAKRVDMVLAGACLADFVLSRLVARRFVACTWALREGLLLDYIQRHGRGIEESAEYADVRRRSVMRLLRHFGPAGPHPTQVARLALRIFDPLAARMGMDGRAREWLEYAALLHDVGHLIDHERHHQHSYYLIVNSDLSGFSPEEREIIGQVARHHHRGGSPKARDGGVISLAPSDWKVVKALSAVLRIAEGLDRTHYGVVRDIRVRQRGGRTILDLAIEGDTAALEVWEAQCRTELLSRVLRSEVVLRVAQGRGKRAPR